MSLWGEREREREKPDECVLQRIRALLTIVTKHKVLPQGTYGAPS